LQAVQDAQRHDATTTRLFRSLWLYIGLYHLANPRVPRSGTEEWQSAVGRLAAVTPILLVGTDGLQQADMTERLKVGGLNTPWLMQWPGGLKRLTPWDTKGLMNLHLTTEVN